MNKIKNIIEKYADSLEAVGCDFTHFDPFSGQPCDCDGRDDDSCAKGHMAAADMTACAEALRHVEACDVAAALGAGEGADELLDGVLEIAAMIEKIWGDCPTVRELAYELKAL